MSASTSQPSVRIMLLFSSLLCPLLLLAICTSCTVASSPPSPTLSCSLHALDGDLATSCPGAPPTAPVVQSLSSSNWSLSNANGSIAITNNCSIPGSVYLDLTANGLLDDLLYRWNPINATWVSSESSWTYSRAFDVDAALLSLPRVELVLHGVDTVANVSLNGHYLGSTYNQFRRWTFDVTAYLQSRSTLTITLLNAHTYSQSYKQRAFRDYSYYSNGDATFIRKSQSDFGWDWGPAFVNMGVHQPVELRGYVDAVLSEMTVTHVFWEDASEALRSEYALREAGDVLLNVTVYVSRTPGGLLTSELVVAVALPTPMLIGTGVSIAALPFSNSSDADRLFPVSFPVVVRNGTYSLWWPNGYGAHPLYNVTATLTVHPSSGMDPSSSQLSRRIGFRRVFLRRLPIEGQPGRTMYFEVNGVPIFDKGSNLVPATAFHVNESAITRRTLQSAVEAHQSIIRVWGGGVYETDDAYDFADEAGLMMWQESIFANSFYPALADFLANVKVEVAQQVRRLVSHPSLVVWCGNNEVEGDILTGSGKDSINHDHALIDYNRLFDDTIRSTLVDVVGLYEDGTSHLEYIMSSPANGPVSLDPFTWAWGNSRDLSQGDLHYYQYDVDCSVPSNFPQPRHLTEWGWQSYPSFITWQPVTAAEDWKLDSPLMQNRQHHPDGNAQQLAQIQRHFHVPNATSPRQAFDDYVYVSQAVAALCYGSLMSYYRTQRDEAPAYTMGSMYWQLADQWQAPTWSSIEVGGRWKQNHYAVKRAFAPLMISGHINSTDKGDTLSVYVVSDVQLPIDVQWAIELRRWSNGSVVHTVSGSSDVPKHYSKLVWKGLLDTIVGPYCDRIGCFLRLAANASSGACNQPPAELEWFLFLAPLSNVTLLDPTLEVSLVPTSSAIPASLPSISSSGWDHCSLLQTSLPPPPSAGHNAADQLVTSVRVNVSTAAVAAYVWLETTLPGRWSDNSMMVLPGRPRLVEFIAYEPFDASSFIADLQMRSIRDTYTRHDDGSQASIQQRPRGASIRLD